ncbi:MAG TPA: M20/M25/M40 family metallo-hydrolase [Pseudonocardiaceae bacterium]|nr:M20/M25/M40 family metallo-hydrolase [Pseudonocardiaceae bacterium]
MDQQVLRDTISTIWDQRILPSLAEFVRIPAVSAAYDSAWREHGQLRQAAEHLADWVRRQDLTGATVEIVQHDDLAPLVLVEIPATPGVTSDETALLYGHLDKQPPFEGWSDGLGPWEPVRRGERLYGRGSADDGYAGYAAIAAVSASEAAGGEHCRIVVLLETGEESGSPDLPGHLVRLKDRLGRITLVTCLDSGGGDFERLWLTRSLRGVLQATLTVSILDKAVHSGIASGVVPSSFRIMRVLLDRLEDALTGRILLPEMNPEIPAECVTAAKELAKLNAGASLRPLSLVSGARPTSDDEAERVLNNTWRPTLSIIGASGMPDVSTAGAVLRAGTSLRLSFRLPPTANAMAAVAAVERLTTTDVPYGAQATLTEVIAQDGWYAPETPPWLASTLDEVGDRVFGEPHQYIGLGGGIPFMQMLGTAYPESAFLVTGAIGADSNMHVPDEWLHIPFARRVTEAVAHVLVAHARQAARR